MFRASGKLQAAGPGASATTLERTALVLAHGAPDAGILSCFKSPGQALAGDRATLADGLGFGDLQERWSGIPDREEQLRILVAADCAVAPVHLVTTSFVMAAQIGTAGVVPVSYRTSRYT
jgi:hypothetical protein